MDRWKIVETDNFDSDYPNEKFVNIPYFTNKVALQTICEIINNICSGDNAPRYWKVVKEGYVLQLGFVERVGL